MQQIVLITHNLRSTFNVGAILRTAEGLGVAKLYLTGYTPFPLQKDDPRLPHLARKIDAQIHKTALGAEQLVEWEHRDDITQLTEQLHAKGYRIAALEQAKQSLMLPSYRPPTKLALIVGREVEGIEPEVLARCDDILEIPMAGRKESFNVAAAAAMALYHLTLGS